MSEKDLSEAPAREPDLLLHFDGSSGKRAPEGKADRCMRVWLRLLNGADDLAIQEAMLKVDGRGQTRLDVVGGDLPKFCRSIEWVDGFDFSDGDSGKVGEARYLEMPRWAILKIRAEINANDDLGPEAVLDSE